MKIKQGKSVKQVGSYSLFRHSNVYFKDFTLSPVKLNFSTQNCQIFMNFQRFQFMHLIKWHNWNAACQAIRGKSEEGWNSIWLLMIMLIYHTLHLTEQRTPIKYEI